MRRKARAPAASRRYLPVYFEIIYTILFRRLPRGAPAPSTRKSTVRRDGPLYGLLAMLSRCPPPYRRHAAHADVALLNLSAALKWRRVILFICNRRFMSYSIYSLYFASDAYIFPQRRSIKPRQDGHTLRVMIDDILLHLYEAIYDDTRGFAMR